MRHNRLSKWYDKLVIYFTVELDVKIAPIVEYRPEDDIVPELYSGYQYIMF